MLKTQGLHGLSVLFERKLSWNQTIPLIRFERLLPLLSRNTFSPIGSRGCSLPNADAQHLVLNFPHSGWGGDITQPLSKLA